MLIVGYMFWIATLLVLYVIKRLVDQMDAEHLELLPQIDEKIANLFIVAISFFFAGLICMHPDLLFSGSEITSVNHQ